MEGRIVETKKYNSILARIERTIGIPTEFYKRLGFETGEEPYISVGVSTRIIPYYAKLRYFLDPEDQDSPYYLFSLGVNFVDGEEISFDKVLDNLAQRINYGVGVGVMIDNTELEILYGKYNYQMVGIPHSEEKDLYTSTKLSFNYKYRFWAL